MRQRKAQILDAAARLISQRGFNQTSVDDVIAAADLSGKSHFYHYFKSKDELGYAVLDRQLERFTERGLAIIREPMIDPVERLLLFIDSLAALQAERGRKAGSAFGALAAEMADSHEGFRRRLELVFERWADQLQSLLREAKPQLKEGIDEARLATFIIATLEGAVLMARVTRESGVMEGIALDLRHYIAMHVRAGAEAIAIRGTRAEPSSAPVGSTG